MISFLVLSNLWQFSANRKKKLKTKIKIMKIKQKLFGSFRPFYHLISKILKYICISFFK